MREIRSTIQALLKSPGATVIAILTLALGMGANTALFSLLNAVELRPLPIPRPYQLTALATKISDDANGGDQPFSLQMFDEIRRRQQVFSDVFGWYSFGVSNFEADGRPFAAVLAAVSGTYYNTMGITPLLGRFIQPSDVAILSGTSNAVAVISYRAWREWYRGESNIIGKLIRVGKQPFTVIGVEPEDYSGLIIDGSADITVPIYAPGQITLRDPGILWLRLYGRLKPGLTIEQARASFQVLWLHILEATEPPGLSAARQGRFFARRIAISSAATGVSQLRKQFSYPLRVLLGLVGAVLLIACLNLASLTLARAASHQHESGVRAALGASAWDLVRRPLTESLVISFTGAFLGLAVAYWTSRALLAIAWTGLIESSLRPTLDARVLAFTAIVAAVTGVLFAIAPAWHAAQADPMEALQQRTRSVRGGSTLLGRCLLIAQIALSLALVAGALLFGRTLSRLHNTNAGYRRDHLLTMMLLPLSSNQQPKYQTGYYRELVRNLQRLAGVESVSFSLGTPASESEGLEAVRASQVDSDTQAVGDFVAPDFFHVLGMHVLSGREFEWRDDARDQNIAIISQSLADRLFKGRRAVGRVIYLGPRAFNQRLTIVGVVNSASLWKVEDHDPLALYRPLVDKYSDVDPMIVLRTFVDPRSLKASAERVVRSLGRHYSLRTMTVDERLDTHITAQRLTALLTGLFSAIALLIASLGLYGLMSYQIARRTSELGVRIALGARPRQVLSMVLREVFLLATTGCFLGLWLSVLLGHFVANILFGVSPRDPIILGLAGLTLMAVALIAGLAPARRAALVDPIEALRVE
ncbi:MAG TPA: ABC transporter permease [Bryobacteraceae bacterium]|jgi:predicted permease|nr:ABC transporter permease [Bryobacteraceae bacterium]